MADHPALDVCWKGDRNVEALCELIHATIDDFEPLAIHDRNSADLWRVFFRTAQQRDGAADALRTSLGDRLSDIQILNLPDDGWARRSQEDLKAVRIGRVIVAPPWDSLGWPLASGLWPRAPLASGLRPRAPDIVIVIDPSTGFGTGHHETTRLCLALLQELELTRRRVIDVGTGSGVLAIAAAKLGAASVVALDHDPDALQNARQNVARNGAADLIEIEEAELASCSTRDPADVVIANLTAGALQRHAARLTGLLKPGGALLISGFDPDALRQVAAVFGRAPVREARDGEWAAAVL